MRALHRTRVILPVLPLLLGVACDPQGPGAMGRLTVSPEADIDSGRTLEIRTFPDDGQAFDPATANLSDREWLRRESWDLTRMELPSVYQVGGEMGYTDHERWRLVIWIAESEDVERPRSGEWYGTRLFNLNECGMPFSGYCSITDEVDIDIDQQY